MKEKYIIISPCFNEEKVIATFLETLENKLSSTERFFTVVMVDDASTDSTPEILRKFKFASADFQLKVIRLNCNSGHQEAIRQGLMYAQRIVDNVSGIVVMDSDGEDDPNAIIELIKMKDFDIVFVARGKRHEGLKFKLGYFFYKILFKTIIGRNFTFGNYSLISPKVLNSLYTQKYFHYAAFLSKQKFDIQQIFFQRQKRIDGKSKMSYKSLVIHGLKSMIEYSEEILFFLMKFFLLIFLFLVSFGIYILYSKFISHKAILGWASSLGANLVNACLIIMSTIILGLILLSIKNSLRQDSNNYHEIK
ncbi:MAG: glycosyltransferase [Cytophagales bacterium]|nr:glycosyltransferase [Cytophagales bacterium]